MEEIIFSEKHSNGESSIDYDVNSLNRVLAFKLTLLKFRNATYHRNKKIYRLLTLL